MTNIKRAAEAFGLTGDLTMGGEGPAMRRARRDARARSSESYRRALVEAKHLWEAAWAGDRAAALLLNEAITTSDLFKSATGEVLDTMTLAAYADVPTQWTKFAARTTVPNFRPKRLLDLAGNTKGLARVPEKTNYPIADYSMAERTISVGKFGEQFGYTFESRINDEYGELQLIPNGWARSARYTEDDEALKQLADPTTGAPNPAFFTAGNGNIGTGALTQARLETAFTLVTTKRDANGRIMRPGPLQLIVGPSQQLNAQRILNTLEMRYTDAGGRTIIEANPMAGKVTLTVLENLPGNAWFLVPQPDAPRPAFYVAFLVGFETPDTRYKADQGNRLGGGAVPLDQGSFDNDTIWYRVRHIVGAATGDPKFTYASDGIGA